MANMDMHRSIMQNNFFMYMRLTMRTSRTVEPLKEDPPIKGHLNTSPQWTELNSQILSPPRPWNLKEDNLYTGDKLLEFMVPKCPFLRGFTVNWIVHVQYLVLEGSLLVMMGSLSIHDV